MTYVVTDKCIRARHCPVLAECKPPPADAEHWAEVRQKRAQLAR